MEWIVSHDEQVPFQYLEVVIGKLLINKEINYAVPHPTCVTLRLTSSLWKGLQQYLIYGHTHSFPVPTFWAPSTQWFPIVHCMMKRAQKIIRRVTDWHSCLNLLKTTQSHINTLRNSFYAFRKQENYVNFRTCCIISVLFSTKCNLFHTFVYCS